MDTLIFRPAMSDGGGASGFLVIAASPGGGGTPRMLPGVPADAAWASAVAAWSPTGGAWGPRGCCLFRRFARRLPGRAADCYNRNKLLDPNAWPRARSWC